MVAYNFYHPVRVSKLPQHDPINGTVKNDVPAVSPRGSRSVNRRMVVVQTKLANSSAGIDAIRQDSAAAAADVVDAVDKLLQLVALSPN